MSEQNRRRSWQPVAEANPKTHNCSVCGQDHASYSINEGWNWFCWKCVPKNKENKGENYA